MEYDIFNIPKGLDNSIKEILNKKEDLQQNQIDKEYGIKEQKNEEMADKKRI